MKFVKPIELFHSLIKNTSSKQGKLLGLDVGNRYVGLAVSDHTNKIASPLSVLVRNKSNIHLMAKDFRTLASEFELHGLIVGMPIQRLIKPEAIRVRCFVDDLRNTEKLDGLVYTYWDENFTSKTVEALLQPLDLHPVESKTILDKFAAVGILQGYLDSMHKEVKREADHRKE